MPLEIIRNDITKMDVDAIVNAANTHLEEGGGVCGAIFAAAGARELAGECRAIGRCEMGSAVITKGYTLPARHIIHAVGPIWRGGRQGEEALLASCYTSALALAKQHGCATVAFPLISSGTYGYPKDQALRVAISAIGAFLLQHDMTVYLVVFDKAAYALSDRLFRNIETYIDDHYVDEHPSSLNRLTRELEFLQRSAPRGMAVSASSAARSLGDVVSQVEETFSQALLRLIDEKGRTDVSVYKGANVDRKLFSKIRGDADYQPSKTTALAFAVALRLNLDETRDLLGRAGFALSHSSKADLIVEYFISEGTYDIHRINEALFAFDQKLLGA